MTMQHRKGVFDGRSVTGFVSVPRVGGGEVMVRATSLTKQDSVADDLFLRIDHLNMASRGAVERLQKDDSAPKPGWYCLRVMTGREIAVEKLLDAGDVESLVVMTNECKVVRRKRVIVMASRPVISGYVLVRCCAIPAAIMGLLAVDNVLDVVGGAIKPWRADEKSISKFKAMAEEGKYDGDRKIEHSFMLEEQVRVTDGPFASFNGIIVAIDDERGFVTTEVDIFGRSTPVQLMLDQIEKI